jgi:diguanylate cyclase (GGDEF)-like protein
VTPNRKIYIVFSTMDYMKDLGKLVQKLGFGESASNNDIVEAAADKLFSVLGTKDHGYLDLVIAKLKEEGDFDSLTGRYGKDSFKRDFGRAHSLLNRSKVPFAIMIADVDDFKSVNDSYGHLVGNDVLREIAFRLGSGRAGDDVYRYAGDEFAGIYSGVSNGNAVTAAKKAVERVSTSRVHGQGDVIVSPTVSLGLYLVKKDDDFRSSFDKADKALYRAKKAGKGRVSL